MKSWDSIFLDEMENYKKKKKKKVININNNAII